MCYLFYNKIINSKYKRQLIFQPSFYKISKLVIEMSFTICYNTFIINFVACNFYCTGIHRWTQ